MTTCPSSTGGEPLSLQRLRALYLAGLLARGRRHGVAVLLPNGRVVGQFDALDRALVAALSLALRQDGP